MCVFGTPNPILHSQPLPPLFGRARLDGIKEVSLFVLEVAVLSLRHLKIFFFYSQFAHPSINSFFFLTAKAIYLMQCNDGTQRVSTNILNVFFSQQKQQQQQQQQQQKQQQHQQQK